MAEGKWNELLGNPLPCSSNQLKTLHSSWKIITILFKQSTPTCTLCEYVFIYEKREGGKQELEDTLENYSSWKNILKNRISIHFLESYDCWLDSATLFLIVRRESRVKWKAGNLKICTKGRNVGRTKDRRRERGKGTWVEREKGREGEVKKASKLSRAIIPSWRVQRQRERTLPGIKVLQTCGKCSWGRVGRPRSNQTNRGTSVNLPAAKDYSWNSLCHAEFPVPFFFNDKIARYKVGRR